MVDAPINIAYIEVIKTLDSASTTVFFFSLSLPASVYLPKPSIPPICDHLSVNKLQEVLYFLGFDGGTMVINAPAMVPCFRIVFDKICN